LVNIGTAYVDASTTEDSTRIDTNGMSTVTLQIMWTKIGAGTQTCEFVNRADTTQVLIRFGNLVSTINTNASQTIPASWTNTILDGKLRCKSTTAADDPVFLHADILLKP